MTWWKFWEKGASGRSPDYYEEGVVLVGQELYHEALTSFRLALKEDPDDPAPLPDMAEIVVRQRVRVRKGKRNRRQAARKQWVAGRANAVV